MNVISTISPLSPFFDTIVSPSLIIDETLIVTPNVKTVVPSIVSPINFISTPGGIVPPTVLNVSNVNPLLPKVLPQSLIITEDIFVPSIQFLSDGRNINIPLSLYDDVCDVENIKNQIVSSFYYKFLDKWLYDRDDAKKILGFFKIVNDKVVLIENIEKREDVSHDTQEIVDKKVDFIEKNIVTKHDIYAILKKFIDETRISWCRLVKAEELVKSSVIHSIKNKIKKMIK
jgi:hypothetical protein